jgi:multicomponent Na+:H+ antiporter subunit E
MMRPILTPILAIVWVLITGSASPANILVGLGAAALALAIVREPGRRLARYRVRPLHLLMLALTFLKELALSAWTVAVTVVSPRMEVGPGIFAFPLTVTRDFEITLLANLITLTPGTLSVDVSDDRKTLFVHALDCSDPQAARRAIAEGFERRILEAFR